MRIDLGEIKFPINQKVDELFPELMVSTEMAMVSNVVCYVDRTTGDHMAIDVELNESSRDIIARVMDSDDMDDAFVRSHIIQDCQTVTLLTSFKFLDSNGEEPKDWSIYEVANECFNMSRSLNSAFAKIFKLSPSKLVWLQLQPFCCYDNMYFNIESEELCDLEVERFDTQLHFLRFMELWSDELCVCYPNLVVDTMANAVYDFLFVELSNPEDDIPELITLQIYYHDIPLNYNYYPQKNGLVINSLPHRVLIVPYKRKLHTKKQAKKLLLDLINTKRNQREISEYNHVQIFGLPNDAKMFMINFKLNNTQTYY